MNKRWLFVLIISFFLIYSFYYLNKVIAKSKLDHAFFVTSQLESTPYFLPLIVNSGSMATPTATPTATNTATPSPTSTPLCDYGPYNLPHHLQFENYTCGGEGIAYHDADPSNNGGEYRLDEAVDLAVAISPGWGDSYFVGWTEENEWLKYEVYIDYSETYYFIFFVSSLYDSGRFHLEIDDVDITGTLIVPNTGDEQNWQTILTPDGTFLEAGYHTFKLVIESGGGNFDFLRTFPATPTPQVP